MRPAPGSRNLLPGPLCLGLCVLLLGVPAGSRGAPKPDLWPRWEAHDPSSRSTMDHGAWGRFLATYLLPDHPSGIARLRYAAVTAADRDSLDQYIASLAAVAVSGLNRAEQKAYWINLYNALTVQVVLDDYPVDSIRDIKSGWFTPGPWELKLVTVEGVEVTLNDIEHRILRPIWQDNRIHYAVNCASLGCPDLQLRPFTAENTEGVLDAAARGYVNHPRGARLEDGVLTASSIYDWFQEDFGNSAAGVLDHLRRYADPGLAEALQGYQGPIRYRYDWRLNNP